MSSVPQVFQFEHDGKSTEIRTTIHQGEPYFVGSDVCQGLGIVNHRDAIANLPETWKTRVGVTDSIGRIQSTLCIKEAGVYKLAFRSNKPEAEAFTNWVASEVLPSIRKTGSYHTGQSNNSLEYRYRLSGSTPQDIKRDQAILARLQEADALLTGKRTVREEKAPHNHPAISAGQKRSTEEKILQYIKEHQHITHDTDLIPTARNLSRYTREPMKRLRADIQDLLDQGKIETFSIGKASCYRLTA